MLILESFVSLICQNLWYTVHTKAQKIKQMTYTFYLYLLYYPPSSDHTDDGMEATEFFEEDIETDLSLEFEFSTDRNSETDLLQSGGGSILVVSV